MTLEIRAFKNWGTDVMSKKKNPPIWYATIIMKKMEKQRLYINKTSQQSMQTITVKWWIDVCDYKVNADILQTNVNVRLKSIIRRASDINLHS